MTEKEQKHYEKPLAPNSQIYDSMINGHDLKVWMKQYNIWNIDLFEILVSKYKVLNEQDLKIKIKNENILNEIIKQTKLRRQESLKSQDSLERVTNLLNRFENKWRDLTGIPRRNDFSDENQERMKKYKLSQKANKETVVIESDEKELEDINEFPTKKVLINEMYLKKGEKLKKWMQTNCVWESYLFQQLIKHEIYESNHLNKLKEKDWENMKISVRVNRFKFNNDTQSRLQCDKILTKFEKLWKKTRQK